MAKLSVRPLLHLYLICVTPREVELTTMAIQKALRLTGCSPGAKIGIYGANSPEWTQTMLVSFPQRPLLNSQILS